jgi:hypothetical protein
LAKCFLTKWHGTLKLWWHEKFMKGLSEVACAIQPSTLPIYSSP